MKKVYRRVFCGLMAVVFALPLFALDTAAEELPPLGEAMRMTGAEITLEYGDSYAAYRQAHRDAVYPDVTVQIDNTMLVTEASAAKLVDNYAQKEGLTAITPDDGAAVWRFSVPQTGLYCMRVEYYPVEGKGTSIVRTVRLDGQLPFNEARNVTFFRNWTDEVGKNGETIQQDPNGNDLRPQQVESPEWMTTEVTDASGLTAEPFAFYLTEGEHTLQLSAVQEPMAIGGITLFCPQELPTAEEVRSACRESGYTAPQAEPIKIQAERPDSKTDAMMMPSSERSSPAMEPSDAAVLKLNVIGTTGWTQAGSGFTYAFEVKTAGLYQIGIKTRQNFNSGANNYRRILIDGAVPCRELNAFCFPYARGWNMTLLGDEAGAYPIYLTAGRHTVSLVNTLGDMAEIMAECTDLLTACNKVYTDILVLTGPTPDVNRDYKFDSMIPDTLEQMAAISGSLKALCTKMESGKTTGSADTKTLVQLYTQLDMMLENINRIAERMTAYQNDLDAFGSWINTMKSQPLAMDYLVVTPLGGELPAANAGFWETLAYHVENFLASFIVDYNDMNYGEAEKQITVWVGSGMTGGRDQAQILKSMADDSFTPEHNISVSLKLVSMGALLPATLAGQSPDIALSLNANDAANYAFRGAAKNLREFADFEEIAGRFASGALVPLTFQDMVYALPETQTFLMMFYRKDILRDLGITNLPDTWDEVIALLPVLQKNQLEFGMPNATGAGASATAVFYSLLMQHNGQLYTDDTKRSLLDSDQAIEALTFHSDLYTQYELQQSMDFLNRFRSGSAPIGIFDYTLFNQLSVFAPELSGLWSFAPVPGTVQADGKINRTDLGSVTGCILMSQSKDPEAAWEFLKWWTDAPAQITFGQQLESIMGTAARYPTANQEAIYQLAWTNENYAVLKEQWKTVQGIPQVPGGYLTDRYVDFAFRDVVLSGKLAGDSLQAAAKTINSEIEQKRREFALDQ